MNRKFWFAYLLLTACQAVICNYVYLTPAITLTLLPAIVMCIPVEISLSATMIIAFLTGLFVDFTADTVIGLNALALVPVALCRNLILKWAISNDFIDRKDTISFKAKGFGKVTIVALIATTIFMSIYILTDGAGMRSFSFNLVRFISSTVLSCVLSLVAIKMLSPEDKLN